jgi:hypothetical protein
MFGIDDAIAIAGLALTAGTTAAQFAMQPEAQKSPQGAMPGTQPAMIPSAQPASTVPFSSRGVLNPQQRQSVAM